MLVERVALRGSERQLMPQAQTVGNPDPNSWLSVTVLLRRRTTDVPEPGAQTFSREEFAERFGANPDDVAPVEQFASDNDLTVGEVDLARRTIVLAGTVANMNEAFATELFLFQTPAGMFRGRVGHLYIPVALDGLIVGVFGLDERPQAKTHLRRRIAEIGPRAVGDTSYTPIAVSHLYNYPTSGTGSGQTVGIIELGGGFRSADLKMYFSALGIKKNPSVVAVSVDNAQNQPVGDPNSADGEVLLDIEIVGAIAPAAKIAVYLRPIQIKAFLTRSQRLYTTPCVSPR